MLTTIIFTLYTLALNYYKNYFCNLKRQCFQNEKNKWPKTYEKMLNLIKNQENTNEGLLWQSSG